MNRSVTAGLLLMIVLGATPQAFAAQKLFSSTNVSWGPSSAPIQVGPGDQNAPLFVSLQYVDTQPIISLTAILFLPVGFTNTTGSQVAVAKTVNVSPDSIFQVVFNVDVASTAAIQTYNMPMTITYFTPSSGSTSLSASLSISVALDGKATLSFSSPSQALTAGQANNVKLVLSNTGTGPASQISIGAVAPQSLSILSSFTTVASLVAQSTAVQTMSIFVPSSAQGSAVSVVFTATFKDPYGNSQTTTQTVGYYVSVPQSSFTVIAGTQTLTGNALNPVVVSIVNTGNSTLFQVNLAITSQPSATIIGSDGKIFLGTIAPGQVVQPTVKLFVASSAGSTLSVPIQVTYRDSSGTLVSEARSLNFEVSLASPVYDISASTHLLAVGQQTPVALTLTNTGNSQITNVAVTLLGQLPLAVVGGDGRYSVALLAPGTQAVLNTILYLAPPVSAQLVPLQFSINYRDASGVPASETRTLTFFAASAPGSFVLLNTAWGDQSNPVEVGPGDTNAKLSLTLQYFGNATVTSLHGVLVLPSSFTDQNGRPSAFSYATNLSPSSIFVLSYALDVAQNANVSTYAIPLLLSWNDSLSGSRSADLAANVPLNGKVDLVVSAPNSGLSPGKVNTVNVAVTNRGTGTVSQLQLSPTLSGGSILNKVDKILVIEAGSTVTAPVQIFVPQSSAGLPLSLSFGLTYYDSYGNSRTGVASVGLFVQSAAISLSPLVIAVTPRALLAGQSNNMTISVANTGSTPINNLSISFTPSSAGLTWINPTLLQLVKLSPGQNTSVPASIYVNAAAPDSNVLQLTVKYFDINNNLNQETRNFGILTKGVVELILQDASTIPQEPASGQIFSISGTITNIGTTAASGLAVTPELPNGFTIFGSKSVFVGDVAVNTPTTFTVSISIASSTAPGSYNIPLRLTYLDNLRESIQTLVNVPISVGAASANSTGTGSTGSGTSRGGAGTGLLTIIVAPLVAVIALAAGYLLARRRYAKR